MCGDGVVPPVDNTTSGGDDLDIYISLRATDDDEWMFFFTFRLSSHKLGRRVICVYVCVYAVYMYVLVHCKYVCMAVCI